MEIDVTVSTTIIDEFENAYSPEELGRAEAIATIMNVAEGFKDGLLNKLQMLDEIKRAIAKL